MSLATNLISWWSLDEASGSRADSHGSNTLTDNNTVTSATGKVSNAANFTSASSEYLSIALGSTGLELSTSFTLSFWVKADNTSTQWYYGSGTNANFWSFGMYGSRFTFTEDNIADNRSTFASFASGTWYHITVTKNGNSASNLKIYIDGSLDSTHSVGVVATPTGTAYMGRQNAGFYFDGLLDEFAIWSRALDSTEVSTLYNSGSGIDYATAVGGGTTFRPITTMIM